ncbi:MAG: PilZ domain-containing protein [Pyrinomonadaceae bacterium]|nr:PilZ domain-containing protein [Pyrinomonadaceae bacterium]
MLQLIRSLETNLRNFVRSLRQAPRQNPRLPFSLTMLDQQPRSSSKGTRPAISVSGYTRNISETGIALLVPAISKGDHHLAARNRRLLIVLELPTGTIRVQAAPVRYERLGKRAEQAVYLIGVRIISMSDDDRVRLLRYLHRLSRGARLSSRQRSLGS